ncbi:MAG: lysylphosphatidylglycerol synthase transmembrane domain-containing protein [Thermoleophilia bacterium]
MASEETDATPATRRSIAPWLALGVAVSAGAIVLAIRDIDLAEVGDAIEGASMGLFLAGVVLILLSYPFLALRWRSLATLLGPPGPGRMLELVMIGAAVNNALPARLGEVARSLGLARTTRRPVLESFGTVVVDRVADAVLFTVLFGATVAVSPTPGWVRWVGVGGALITVAAVGLLVGVAFFTGRRGGPPPDRRWLRHVFALAEGFRCVRSTGAAVRALVLSVVAWAVWVAGAWLVGDAIGFRLSLTEVLMLVALLGLGSAVPSAPGFIGTYHWIAASAVGLFGVTRPDALAYAVLLHAAWFIPTTVIGSLLMVRWGLGFAALRRVSLTSRTAEA